MIQKLRNFVSTVWKNEKFGLTEKIFRQINSLVICLAQCGKRGHFTITIFAQKLEKISSKQNKCQICSIYFVKPL